MFNAKKPQLSLSIPFGTLRDSVGGVNQDTDRMGSGIPDSIKADGKGKVWVLDSLNKAIKLFNEKGKVEQVINLSSLDAEIFSDFDISQHGVVAVLDRQLGRIFVMLDGELVSRMETFNDAIGLRLSQKGDELLVDLPIAEGIVRLNLDGDLLGIYQSPDGLSLYEKEPGKLWGLRLMGKNAQLYIRNSYAASDETIVAEFPYGAYKDVDYAKGEIIGVDSAGNVHLSLLAVNDYGIIYRERLYKCSPQGAILDYADILTVPAFSFVLTAPRNRVLSPEGEVYGFCDMEDSYLLYKYTAGKR